MFEQRGTSIDANFHCFIKSACWAGAEDPAGCVQWQLAVSTSVCSQPGPHEVVAKDHKCNTSCLWMCSNLTSVVMQVHSRDVTVYADEHAALQLVSQGSIQNAAWLVARSKQEPLLDTERRRSHSRASTPTAKDMKTGAPSLDFQIMCVKFISMRSEYQELD